MKGTTVFSISKIVFLHSPQFIGRIKNLCQAYSYCDQISRKEEIKASPLMMFEYRNIFLTFFPPTNSSFYFMLFFLFTKCFFPSNLPLNCSLWCIFHSTQLNLFICPGEICILYKYLVNEHLLFQQQNMHTKSIHHIKP